MKTIYILAGPNGAGKTTAAYTFLPDMLNCKVFINADEIARGLSPFDVDAAAFEAGRIMLEQIEKNRADGNSFAIETTLSTKFYVQMAKRAQSEGYKIVVVFLYLKNFKIAQARVVKRVEKGGHNIPPQIIERRYTRGLKSFFKFFVNLADEWYFIDNENDAVILARKTNDIIETDNPIFRNLAEQYGN